MYLNLLGRAIRHPRRFTAEWEDMKQDLSVKNVALSDAERHIADLTAQLDNSILDSYVTDMPSYETAFKLFEGEWSSDVPGYGGGRVGLFDDGRVKWFSEQCGGFRGKNVLELGPLEGGHTSMIANEGAASVTAIELNARAFLKCLIVQNALKFPAHFLLGDFRRFLENCTQTFDVLIASGVLYHMPEPIALLQKAAKVSNCIGLWTHYYDTDVIENSDVFRGKFEPSPRIEQVGARQLFLYRQSYLDTLKWKGFCGGSAPISYWLSRESLLGLLEDLGFKVVIGEDTKTHPNGPAMTLFASRQPKA